MPTDERVYALSDHQIVHILCRPPKEKDKAPSSNELYVGMTPWQTYKHVWCGMRGVTTEEAIAKWKEEFPGNDEWMEESSPGVDDFKPDWTVLGL